jgi:hypothetical protein
MTARWSQRSKPRWRRASAPLPVPAPPPPSPRAPAPSSPPQLSDEGQPEGAPVVECGLGVWAARRDDGFWEVTQIEPGGAVGRAASRLCAGGRARAGRVGGTRPLAFRWGSLFRCWAQGLWRATLLCLCSWQHQLAFLTSARRRAWPFSRVAPPMSLLPCRLALVPCRAGADISVGALPRLAAANQPAGAPRRQVQGGHGRALSGPQWHTGGAEILS